MAIVAEEVAEEVTNEPSEEDVIELELADEAEVAKEVNVDIVSIFAQVH